MVISFLDKTKIIRPGSWISFQTNLIILMNHSGSLEKIVTNIAADNLTFIVKMNLYELSKSRRVIVSSGLGVAKSLKNWISIEDFLLQGSGRLSKVAA